MIVVNVDGLTEPVNPGGIATFGYIMRDEDSGRVIGRKSGFVGRGPAMSNNVAEYAALCEVLKVLLNNGKKDEQIEVRSDSKLLVNQMAGNWKFREGLYEAKYREALELATIFSRLSFRWVPREENEEADMLTREAYERVQGGRLG